MIRILLVDDQKVIREGLKLLFQSETDFQIVGTANDGISALRQVEELRPDIVLMNMEMPVLDGVATTENIAKNFRNTKVLIFSSYDTDEHISKSLSVGAKGYLLKNTEPQDIADAIRSVNKGYTHIGPGLLEKVLVTVNSGTSVSSQRQEAFTNEAIVNAEKKIFTRSRRAIVELQSNTNRHQVELERIEQDLKKLNRELPATKKKLSGSTRSIWGLWTLLLAGLPLIYFLLFTLYSRLDRLENGWIPIQRVGLYGELHQSGLAQRVTNAFEQNNELAGVETVFVAQTGSKVILKGQIDNTTLLSKMKLVAEEVPGVTQVDTSQVTVN